MRPRTGNSSPDWSVVTIGKATLGPSRTLAGFGARTTTPSRTGVAVAVAVAVLVRVAVPRVAVITAAGVPVAEVVGVSVARAAVLSSPPALPGSRAKTTAVKTASTPTSAPSTARILICVDVTTLLYHAFP